METVLISGATGFLGFNLCKKLEKEQFHIIAGHRSTSNLEKLKSLDNISFINLEDQNDLVKLFKGNKVDNIVHCATNYGRDNNALSVLNTNVKLPLLLLTESMTSGVKRFINIDSFSSLVKGYTHLPLYHISKRNFLLWAEVLLLKTSLQFTTLRLHHMYGPFDQKEKFVPFIINQLLSKTKEIDLTEGKQKRDFIYVEDVAEIIFGLLQFEEFKYKEIEVGTGRSIAIKDFVELCATAIGNKSTMLNFGKIPTRNNELADSKANTDILKKLGFEMKSDLSKGVNKTIEYHKSN